MTNRQWCDIIYTVVGNQQDMRVCWNWQTGTFEGRVFHDVRVQVPSLAPVIKAVPKTYSLFSCMAVKEIVQLGYHIRWGFLCVRCEIVFRRFQYRYDRQGSSYCNHYFGNWNKVGAKRNYLLLILTDCKKSGRIITEKSYIFQQRKGWQKWISSTLLKPWFVLQHCVRYFYFADVLV